MIQRIQSVYLLVATLLLASFVAMGGASVTSLAAIHASIPLVVYVLAAATGLVGLAALLLYKDRARQVRVITAAQWLDLALILVVVVTMGMRRFGGETEAVVPSMITYVVLLVPVAAYVMFSLGRRAVQKDIALVRSVDRLR